MDVVVPSQPHVRFEVEKVIGVSSAGNVRSYQVQWAPAWVSGFHLIGCEHLINEFLHQQHLDKENDNAATQVISAASSVAVLQQSHVQERSFSGSISREGLVEQQTTKLCSERRNDIETDDEQTDIDGYGSDSADLISAEGTDGDLERTVVKEPDLSSNEFDVGIKEEDGIIVCSSEHGKPETYKHINRVHSPETFRLNNISYLMQKANNNGVDLGDTITSDELSPSSSNNSRSSKKQENQQQQHQQHRQQRLPHSQQLQRTSMVSFHSHRLPQHLIADTKEKAKPYVCEHCDRGFSQRHHLKEHVRTHTGVKPFSCGVCSKTFSQRGTLNRHIQTHVKAAMLD